MLALEFAPLLNRIISPPIRPVRHLSILRVDECNIYITQVNSQVIRPEEKALLSRLVNIMVSLELRFVQERTEDGQLVYRLDPWVLVSCLGRHAGADARLQASRYIRDVRRQVRSGYRPSALCRKAPRGYRGQFTLTLSREIGGCAIPLTP